MNPPRDMWFALDHPGHPGHVPDKPLEKGTVPDDAGVVGSAEASGDAD